MVPFRHLIRFARRGSALVAALVFVSAAGIAAEARADDVADGARTFVRALSDQAIAALTKPDMTRLEREASFRKLFVANFDVPTIGKWALGRFWRVATKEEQDEFLTLFEDFVVTTYANRFRDYTNEHLEIAEVVKSADEDGRLLVHSLIVRDQPKPIRVDWRIAPMDGSYKIVDVAVEGVSMVQTQRSEFSSVILRGGGKVAGLLTELKLKNQSLRAQMN